MLTSIDVVDSHQHFWDPSTHSLAGLTGEYESLRRRFGPDDLAPLLASCGVRKTVAVQAENTAQDSLRLLDLALEIPYILSVVGWIDTERPDPARSLELLLGAPGGGKLAGIRFNARDQPNPNWLDDLGPSRAVAGVVESGLVCELLLRHDNAPAARRLFNKFPTGRFVIDHLMTVPRDALLRRQWRDSLKSISSIETVWVKMSGFIDQAGEHGWRPSDFLAAVHYVLEIWDLNHVMFGTDWPVCTISRSYEQIVEWSVSALSHLDGATRERIMSHNAEACYRSGPRS